MKLVLLKDLKGKGKKGDIIDANDGYALNYLIPQGIAKAGTNSNLNEAKQAKDAQLFRNEQNRLQAVELGKKLSNLELPMKVKCGSTGKTFGSITNKEIAEFLSSLGYDIDKKKIECEPIKQIGIYEIPIKLHSTVTAKIKLNVTAAQ